MSNRPAVLLFANILSFFQCRADCADYGNAEAGLRVLNQHFRHTDLSKCVCMSVCMCVCSLRRSMPAKTQAPLWWWPLHTPWMSWQVSTVVPPLFYQSHVSTMWPGSWQWPNQRPPSPLGSRTAPPLPPELKPLDGFNAGVLAALSPMQWRSALPSGHLWQKSPFPGPAETVGGVCECVCVEAGNMQHNVKTGRARKEGNPAWKMAPETKAKELSTVQEPA